MSALTPPSAMPNSNYPTSHMGPPPSAHVSPYAQSSHPQPYSSSNSQYEQAQDHSNQSPAHFQQYSYDIQLRYPAPAPSFPAPSMAGRFEPPRELPLPPLSAIPVGGGGGYSSREMDTTGQVAPPGVKPRVTATLWEDEGTLCFQVDVKGTCVARREDNHMINGTKLLNVVGMTRGRRDGILKSEKQKHVVKIGPMHLKGVWIPFERALDFANKEKITESLYPLFVHNIGALLHHPINHAPHTFPYPAYNLGSPNNNNESRTYSPPSDRAYPPSDQDRNYGPTDRAYDRNYAPADRSYPPTTYPPSAQIPRSSHELLNSNGQNGAQLPPLEYTQQQNIGQQMNDERGMQQQQLRSIYS